jgi:hypothetical protein
VDEAIQTTDNVRPSAKAYTLKPSFVDHHRVTLVLMIVFEVAAFGLIE